MHCDHCLRGNAQRLDMGDEVIANLFKGIDHVSDITFTGGEPTLAVPVIERIVKAARAARVSIGNFWVATNGKTTPKTARRFALCLLDLYSMLTDREQGLTALTVSGDYYHEDTDIPDVYKGLSFLSSERHGPKEDSHVIRAGRAAENGIGEREPGKLGAFEVGEGCVEDDDLIVHTLYVAANGNVVNDCDQPYKVIDAESRGNLTKETIPEVVRRDMAKVDKRLAECGIATA
jgi:hypothetical protein